jgi:histidinol-phosphatase (PHP family)
MKTDFNYHTHTALCGHAEGTIEEYIERAIEGGIIDMGFSDHAPYMFPDGHESHFRVPVAKAKQYVEDIKAIRKKYESKIDIKIGFEMEYYPMHFERMLKTVNDAEAEYIILGQHFVDNEMPKSPAMLEKSDDVEWLKEYVFCVISAIESGVFTYIAHPDMINFSGDESVYGEEMRKICISSKKHDIPIEINFNGIRNNRPYPKNAFWKMAGEEQCPVTIGFDAHKACDAYDAESLKKAERMIEKYNLNYIGKPHIIYIKNVYKNLHFK